MLKMNDKKYEDVVMENIYAVFNRDLLPLSHITYLERLSCDERFKINTIYDIGSCTMHWHRHAHRIWSDAEIIWFDAFNPLIQLYQEQNVKFENVLLSDVDNLRIKFYQNDMMFGGGSYYRENTSYFPKENYVIKDTITLDTLVEHKNYNYCDLLKIDAQCAELDILKGASKCLEHTTFLILEIPEENSDYNIGGYKQHEILDYLKSIGYMPLAPKFSNNVCDSDWSFFHKNKINNI